MRLVIDPKKPQNWVDDILAKIMGRDRAPPELTKQQRSIVKLVIASACLHEVALAKGVVPRTKDGSSQPLLVMKVALDTLEKGMRQ